MKGGTLMILDGYSYSQDGQTGAKTFWLSEKYKS
jgi:hypothetical protein